MTIIRRAILVLAAVAVATGPAMAQLHPLDATLKAAFDQGELKGLHSLLIIHNGEVLAES